MAKLSVSAPVIGIPACIKEIELTPFHAVNQKYIMAVIQGLDATPVVIPAMGDVLNFDGLLAKVDGLLFPGSISNIQPHHYKGNADRPDSPQDPARDATTLPLLRAAINQAKPFLCICRGMQELNVSLGGSLYQQIHQVSGKMDHREVGHATAKEKYMPRHPIHIQEHSVLSKIYAQPTAKVNSLHWQGINQLAAALQIEATAPDGIIEAVSVKNAATFMMGLQWHPEYDLDDPLSKAIFQAFKKAIWPTDSKMTKGKAA